MPPVRTLDAVKIFGITFDYPRRWPLAIPPLLLIAFLAGLFVLATEGQSRLESANTRVQQSDLREQRLAEYQNLMIEAETAQRGYLITGDEQDLAPYHQAEQHADALLHALRLSYGDDATALDLLRQLRLATGKKLGELGMTVALATSQGGPAAMQLLRTGEGRRYMGQIRSILATLVAREAIERAAATARWRADLVLARWISGAGAVFNILLVMVAARLVLLDMRRRSRQAAELRTQKQVLEDQVAARTQELAALSTHLQEISEQEKYALSRELHDELGGLLVSARMDLSWIERKLGSQELTVMQRFKRIQESLSAGVNLKRRVVEELRPTLLDNMGLFSALRWQIKESCARTGLKYVEKYPEEELHLLPQAAIAIFRTVQEALTNIVKHAEATTVDMAVEIMDSELVIQIADDGKGLSPERLKSLGSHGLASMRHRIEALGGKFGIDNLSSGGALVSARLPLEKILDRDPARVEAAARG